MAYFDDPEFEIVVSNIKCGSLHVDFQVVHKLYTSNPIASNKTIEMFKKIDLELNTNLDNVVHKILSDDFFDTSKSVIEQIVHIPKIQIRRKRISEEVKTLIKKLKIDAIRNGDIDSFIVLNKIEKDPTKSENLKMLSLHVGLKRPFYGRIN